MPREHAEACLAELETTQQRCRLHPHTRGAELRHLNEIALGFVFLSASLICQLTAITGSHIGG